MEKSKNKPTLPTGSGEKAGATVIQRWSATRKREVVLRLLRGESLDAVSREIGVEVYRLERWRDMALAAMDAGLKERTDDDPLQADRDTAHKRVGELSMENELLRARIGRLETGKPSPGEVAQMNAAISPSTQRPYGVQRVCRIWALPRSTFYRANRPANAAPAKPRGPKPPVDDASLLAAIRADLAASPFSGEGHRKVWARLHYGLGLPVGRNRVLRLMRDNQLLSPFRRPPRPANDHDGTILTQAPDVMWGTDATLVHTSEEGRVWVFAAIDHFNSEVVGHHVSTDGSRFSALEPISQAVTARFGGIAANAARGVSLRLDNGPQYTSHHFSHQISHWGVALSYAFPHQPQCNGVIERFFRTLKEQAIWGQTFRTAAEVRTAVSDFVAHYSAAWRLERLGYLSPLDYRARHLQQESRAA